MVTVVEVDEQAAIHLADSADEILQILREILSNVSRHARAETCTVRLTRSGTTAELTVDDDGRGFEPTEAWGVGSGLTNLASRAKARGGGLEVTSAPGAGTTVRLVVPVRFGA